MNCKPGDLAVIVAGIPFSNINRIVRVTKLSPLARHYGLTCWLYETVRPLAAHPGEPACLYIDDDCLRPIAGEGFSDAVTQREPVATS